MNKIKWEYKIYRWSGTINIIERELNVLGNDGWELIAVYDGEYLFKRKIDQRYKRKK